MKLVVIVDDNESLATSLSVAFERIPDVETAIANHPSRALRLFTEDSWKPPIRAMVTDFNLPQGDGLQLIAQVRAIERYRTLPAILITAEENFTCASGCILNRPNAIFRKPFSMKEVCRVLEELLA